MSVIVSPSSQDAEERFGHYVVIHPVRKGGMGALALAFDTSRGEPVLLKRLPPNAGDALRQRFLDEIELTKAFDHPNLTKALDAGVIDGRDFLVCEWIGGPDVERLLEAAGRYELPVPTSVAAGILSQALRGLGALHQAGCFHRDVSPANVMVDYDGTVRLIDYGITKFEGKRSRTIVGAVPGTQGYIAPEVMTGGEVSAKTDLYSAAAALWFMLTGLRFLDKGVDNDGKEVLARELRARGREDVPPSIVTFLWRNLHRMPSVRCDSAAVAERLLVQDAGAAPPAEIAAYVGRLFAGDKQLAAEQANEWRRKYPRSNTSAQATAVLRRVDAEERRDTKRSPNTTLVVDRDADGDIIPRRRTPLVALVAALALAIIASALVTLKLRRNVPRPTEPVPSPQAATPAPIPNEPPRLPEAPPSEPEQPAPHPSPSPPPRVAAPVQRPRTVPQAPILSAEARRQLDEARSLVAAGRTHSAREILTALIEDPAARPQALLGLARLAYKEGAHADAVRFTSDAARAGAGIDALMLRASAYLALGNADKAEADFDRVLAVQPANEEAAEGKKAAQLRKREQ